MKPAVIDQPTLPPVTDEMDRAAEVVAERALAIRGGDPFTEMVERLAANPDVPVEKMERLLAMQERIMDRTAKAEFDAAYAEMQGEIPIITERGEIAVNGVVRSKYAKLEDIIVVVRPIMQKHGFAVRHTHEIVEGKMKIIGVLSHRSGHSERDEFVTDSDSGAGRTAIQALGSARSYGQRYTLMSLLGIATSGVDDDGQGGQRQAEVKAPTGFEAWWAVFEPMAEQGLAALTEAWNKSKVEYRNHLMATNKRAWNELKIKAAKVTK